LRTGRDGVPPVPAPAEAAAADGRPADAAVVRVARQPILDRNAGVVGYELLFRAPRTYRAGVRDDRKATATVIVDGLLDVGLWELVGEKEAYLNVSRDFLLTTALVRAAMCRRLSGAGEGREGDSWFTVGLLSVADALADAPMEEVIGELPFREDIAAALLDGSGEIGKVLGEVIAYERGDFDGAADLISRRGDIDRVYRDATKWADDGLGELV
jgi:c-di-GMP-related signal transduction protein